MKEKQLRLELRTSGRAVLVRESLKRWDLSRDLREVKSKPSEDRKKLPKRENEEEHLTRKQ